MLPRRVQDEKCGVVKSGQRKEKVAGEKRLCSGSATTATREMRVSLVTADADSQNQTGKPECSHVVVAKLARLTAVLYCTVSRMPSLQLRERLASWQVRWFAVSGGQRGNKAGRQ